MTVNDERDKRARDAVRRLLDERGITAWLTDMDGVLVHEKQALPGAAEFISALQEEGLPYLVLTNNPIYSPRDLSARLRNSGIEVPEEHIWTSALATADFVASQHPNGSAYVLGESGLAIALHEAGYTLTETDPDYVILGETRTYSFEAITTAIRLVEAGAKFICTNPDPTGPSENGTLPAAGSVAALISKATGREPYYIGKPNPIMFRTALNRLHAHSESTAMVGDRMDTDVVAGLEAGMRTFLVLTGITTKDMVETFPYRPTHIVPGIGSLVGTVHSGVYAPEAGTAADTPKAETTEYAADAGHAEGRETDDYDPLIDSDEQVDAEALMADVDVVDWSKVDYATMSAIMERVGRLIDAGRATEAFTFLDSLSNRRPLDGTPAGKLLTKSSLGGVIHHALKADTDAVTPDILERFTKLIEQQAD